MTPKDAGVHITTGGFEYDRIIKPMMNRYPVEKLVIFRSRTSPYSGARDLSGKFVQMVKDAPIDTEIIKVDIYDFNEVFVHTMKQIHEHSREGKRVYINISPVPKLATTAMISAAFLSPYKENVEIFYASPEEYLVPKIMDALMDESDTEKLKDLRDRFMKSGAAVGVKDYQQIPVFPIKDISDKDREILSVLRDKDGVDSIEELVDALNEGREDEVRRSSVQYRLELLEKKRLIDTEREDRRLKIRLNQLGLLYLSG